MNESRDRAQQAFKKKKPRKKRLVRLRWWRARPEAWWWTALVVAIPVAVATAASWWLLATATHPQSATDSIDLAKTAFSVGAGTGGVVALILAFRKQWHTEVSSRATEKDALDRRITDLATKAIDQLGSDKAPVRLGGLHNLERLAQGNPDQREAIVGVISAYLRMPFRAPEQRIAEKPFGFNDEAMELASQEREVRLTAQRILTKHLRPSGIAQNHDDTFWANIDLDLSSAVLIGFSLEQCRLRSANFGAAQFIGTARFDGTIFQGETSFHAAQFTSIASFNGCSFISDVIFNRANFDLAAMFSNAEFQDGASFDRAIFGGDDSAGALAYTSLFVNTKFWVSVTFDRTKFMHHASFNSSLFYGTAQFSSTKFMNFAEFTYAHFFVNAEFDNAVFAHKASFAGALFDKAGFDEIRANTDGLFISQDCWARVNKNTPREWPQGWVEIPASGPPPFDDLPDGQWNRVVRAGIEPSDNPDQRSSDENPSDPQE